MNHEKEKDVQPVLFSISVPFLTIVVSILPAFATLFGIIWSVLFNFDAATRTHCGVYNFLPSVSAAIGQFTPQKYIWRICIALHCGPRFLLALSYYNYHTSIDTGKYDKLYKAGAALCTLLHIMENGALIILSYVSSEDNYAIHENMFITFIVASLLYMMLTCFMFSWGRTQNGRQLTRLEKKSLNYKVYVFIFNISIFLLSLYFFFRHNSHCEPTVYSVFAALEYLVVFSNLAFHATLYFDVPNYSLALGDYTLLRADCNSNKFL
ncbi:hypothetical protein SNE40_016124 [Patella caerulea]|uniref:CWH43-like N-terminal domain-containing protein n=1 Tax=Patella caerulea TaxID=87958 RepID=A0AAN8PMK9_PATCE